MEELEVAIELLQEVAASTTVTSDYVIPSGKTLYVLRYQTSCPLVADLSILVKAVHDPGGANTPILAEYGSTTVSLKKLFVGDGVKPVRISLINNSDLPAWIGVHWSGVTVG